MKTFQRPVPAFVAFFAAWQVAATTISPSGEELKYSYSSRFRSIEKGALLTKAGAREAAYFHAHHLFGLFHSPELVEEVAYPTELIEGFAGTKRPKIIRAKSVRQAGDPYLWVEYEAEGTFLLHRPLAKRWLGNRPEAKVNFPLIVDLPAIYNDEGSAYRVPEGVDQSKSRWAKCTDSHYWQSVDFSYFNTPYKCEELRTGPVAEEVEFTLRRDTKEIAARVPINRIYGENENGPLVTLYFANGFDEPDVNKVTRDSGWKSFKFIERLLIRNYGFTEITSPEELDDFLGEHSDHLERLTPVALSHETQRRFVSTFVRRDGERLLVARSGLFNTGYEVTNRPRRTFPKFWKEAWENGDFIYFGGHSGDGESLRLSNLMDSLEAAEVEGVRMNRKKTQIAMLDSCSSYAWYQDAYSSRQPGLNLITFGLVSLFHLAKSTIEGLLELVLEKQSLSWKNALRRIERRQLDAHVNYYYAPEDRAEVLEEFQGKGWVPTSLMSVRVEAGADQ